MVQTVTDVMTRNPASIERGEPAADAARARDDLRSLSQPLVPNPGHRPSPAGHVLAEVSFPAPVPSVNRPSDSTPIVAAFCATTAGW